MKNKPIFWLFKKVKKRTPAILIMTAAHIMQAAFGVLFALGTKAVIDSAVSGAKGEFVLACIKQAGIIATILISITVYRHLKDKLMADLDRDWKKEILHGLLYGEYADVSTYHSAELLNRLNNDVKTVDDSILTLLPNIAAMVTRLVMAGAVLAALDMRFTIVILSAGAVVIVLTGILRKKLKNLHKQVSRMDGKVSGFIQEIMEKLLMVQAMYVSEEVEKRAGVLLEDRYQLQRKRKNVSLVANTAVSGMYYGAGFIALIWCSFHLLNGQMTFGSLTAITQLVNQLQNPFVNLSNIIPRYIAMLAAAERLMELEEVQGEYQAPRNNTSEIYDNMHGIVGKNLTFAYDRDVIFKNADFYLPKNSFTVITGPSGIGKSTLLKAMLGIFKCTEGEMLLTGDTDALIDRKMRRLFAYVPQGNLILSGTIKENIAISNPDATDSDIEQALYISRADEFVHNLPMGIHTQLGESGAGLSEGQLQRIAIARAVLSDAPILLLDECTSALDEEIEKTVLNRIKDMADKTCIAITHRPAALEICDWQMEIRDKKIYCKKR